MAEQSDEAKSEIEHFLVQKTESLRFIISGLENHEPFIRLIEMWKATENSLNDNWHNIYDPVKLLEARATKYASSELTNIIEHMRGDLVRAEIELEKLRNPEKYVQKDYDPD